MKDDEPVDQELESYEAYGLEVMRIDGVVHAEWGGRWLPIDTDEEPPLPAREVLVSAVVAPAGGFMSDLAYYELAKIDDTTLVTTTRIDGVEPIIQIDAFRAGDEEGWIEGFIEGMKESESDAEVIDDEDDVDPKGDGRYLMIFRE